MFWIADDGAFPKPLVALHGSLQAQIVQVWAVPSKVLLPGDVRCELPLENRELPGVEPPAKRREGDFVEFSFGNAANCGQGVRTWLLTRKRSPFLMAETHLGQQDHEKVSQWFTARGWQVLGEPAAESGRGGTHGHRSFSNAPACASASQAVH